MNALEGEVMKFILNGRTFDTATSQTVAVTRGASTPESEFDLDFPALSVRYEHVLYRTAKGAFFVLWHKTLKFDKGKPVVDDFAEELSAEQAIKWIESNRAVILDPAGLPLPDEA